MHYVEIIQSLTSFSDHVGKHILLRPISNLQALRRSCFVHVPTQEEFPHPAYVRDFHCLPAAEIQSLCHRVDREDETEFLLGLQYRH